MLSWVIDILWLAVTVALWVLFGLVAWLFWVVRDSERTDRLCERIEQGRFPFL